MKNKLAKINLSVLTTAAMLLSLSGGAAAAGAANLSLSPSGGIYTVNNTFAVTISENSGSDSVNVVEADLSYNASVLQLVGISCNTSAFEVNAPGSASGVTCGTATPKSGSQAVAVANFKVLASGSSAVSFAGSSHIYRSTDNVDVWNGGTTGGSYTLTAPVAAPVKPAPKPKAPVVTSTSPTVTIPNAPKTPAKPAPVKKQNNRHNINSKLVSDNAGLSAGTYWLIGVVAAAVIAVALVFRKKLLDTAKVVATKYKLGRRVQS